MIDNTLHTPMAMARRAAEQLVKRQNSNIDDGDTFSDYGNESWWWSDTGMAVRYAVICVIFAAILLYFLGGYWHARRRLQKGQPPLAYHRWMVNRSVRYRQPQHHQHQATPFQPYYPRDPYQEGYQLNGYAPPNNPPPAYHGDAPPAYAPPEGASKAMADQNYHPPPPRNENGGEGSTVYASVPMPPRQ